MADFEQIERERTRAVNLHRHLTNVQKRALIAEELTHTPAASDREVGDWIGVSAQLVARVRDELLAAGLPVAQVITTTKPGGLPQSGRTTSGAPRPPVKTEATLVDELATKAESITADMQILGAQITEIQQRRSHSANVAHKAGQGAEG